MLVRQKLKKIRESTSITIQQAADALGYSTASGYTHWEERYKGEHLPMKIYKKLHKLLTSGGIDGVVIDELFGLGQGSLSLDKALLTEAIEVAEKVAKKNKINDRSEIIDCATQLYEIALEQRSQGEDAQISAVFANKILGTNRS